MLSPYSRVLTYLTAGLYAVLGLVLFLLPNTIAPVFAWKVTPFMVMTMGGWCLGNAWLAYITARRWEWRLVYTTLIYLWLFGVIELAVVFAFRSRLNLASPIAWLYLTALGTNAITALIGVIDWLRIRPALSSVGPRPGTLSYISAWAFVLFVATLGLYGMFVPIGGPGTNGGIFPEVMSAFTLRAFAAFYLSLMLGALPLLREKNLYVFLHHSVASYGLVVMISVAFLVFWNVFDLVNRPGGWIYIGAYAAVGIPLLFVFLRHGVGRVHSPQSTVHGKSSL